MLCVRAEKLLGKGRAKGEIEETWTLNRKPRNSFQRKFRARRPINRFPFLFRPDSSVRGYEPTLAVGQKYGTNHVTGEGVIFFGKIKHYECSWQLCK